METKESEAVMTQRDKGILLQCLVFVFFVILAINGVRDNQILNSKLLQLQADARQSDFYSNSYRVEWLEYSMNQEAQAEKKFGLLAREIVGNTESMLELARYARHTWDKLNQETMIAVPGVVDEAMKAVVQIRWPRKNPFAVKKSSGSGFVIDAVAGHIITAKHCADGFKDKIPVTTVTFLNGEKVRVDKVYCDPNDDIAVVVVDVEDPNYPATVGEFAIASKTPRRGDIAIALGGPYGYRHSSALGIVSNPLLAYRYGYPKPTTPITWMRTQVDTLINPGNSGGALINIKGEVIGVVVSGWMDENGGTGVGFCVTIDGINSCLEKFHAWLGTAGVVEMINNSK